MNDKTGQGTVMQALERSCPGGWYGAALNEYGI